MRCQADARKVARPSGRLLALALAASALWLPSSSQAAGPTAIAADSGGTVYAGFASGAVRRYRAADGEALAGWQTPVADADGSLGAVVAMDGAPAGGLQNGGGLWVLDANLRVQEFDRDGGFIRGFRLIPCEGSNDPAPGAKGGIEVTASAVYVAHPCANTVERFDASALPTAGVSNPPSVAAEVYSPHGIAAPLSETGPAATQALYVTQPASSAIRRYDLSTLSPIGDTVPITHTGSPDDIHLSGSAVEDRILVSETANPDPGYAQRIFAFASTGQDSFGELFNFGGQGSLPGRLDRAVAFDAVAAENGTASAVVVADRANERIQRLMATPSDNGNVVWVSEAQDPGPSAPASEGSDISRDPGVKINGGATYTPTPAVILTLAEPRGTNGIEIASDAGFDSVQRFPSGSKSLNWRLEARDADRVRRRVFVRFLGSGRGVVSDEIRLDRGRPKIGSARITRGKSGWVLRVVASDDGSGLSELRVSPTPEGPFRERSFEPRTALEHARDARWVKVADLVGNVSTLARARRRG